MKLANLLEAQKSVLTEQKMRISHPEDMIFDKGLAGAIDAMHSLQATANSPQNISLKVDGSPALIFGWQNNEFVLTDKYGFGKPGGMPTNPEAVEQMIMNRDVPQSRAEGVAERRQYANKIASLYNMLCAATPTSFQGYAQGDLLWTGIPRIKNGFYEFKPDKILYRIPVNSKIGVKIGKGKAGIAIHSVYNSDTDEEPSALRDIERKGFREVEGLVFLPHEVDMPEKLALDTTRISNLDELIKNEAANINEFFNPSGLMANGIKSLPKLMKSFLAFKASKGSADYNNLADEFQAWIKQGATSSRMMPRILMWINQHRDGYRAIWHIVKLITEIKLKLKSRMDAQVHGIIDASLRQKPGHEGFVSVTPDGTIKFVNRSEFMKKDPHNRFDESSELDETLKKVNGKWALVSKKNPRKVLQYYHGSGHPSKEWVSKVERRVHSFSEGVAEGKVKLYTDPVYFGAEVDDAGFDSLPVVNIPTARLVGFEPDSKMQQPEAMNNVKKILAGLEQGDNIPPILVRKYKNGYQVLDGHHRFCAYKMAKKDTIPARVVDPKDIEEITEMADENSTDSEKVVWCFMRANPPTLGHRLVINKAAKLAGEGDYWIFLSHSQDNKKNPLDWQTKMDFMKRIMPKKSAHFFDQEEIKTPIKAADWLYDHGYRDMILVCGSDRVDSMRELLESWNSDEVREKYNRDRIKIKVVSAGNRDPDAKGVKGISGTKARKAVADNDMMAFEKSTGLHGELAKELFAAVKANSGLQGLAKAVKALKEHTNPYLHPHGTIVMLKMTDDCAHRFSEWCNTQNISCIPKEDMHITVLYSKTPVPHLESMHGNTVRVVAKPKDWKVLGEKALVMVLECDIAEQFHQSLRKQGGTHGFSEYIVHTTANYDWTDPYTPHNIPPFPLIYDRIEVLPIDPDFKPGSK